jgi:hypothetical protein
MMRFRLMDEREGFGVDVRLSQIEGRWLASADTPDGPSLGYAFDALAALYLALDPFQPAVDELLASLPALAAFKRR